LSENPTKAWTSVCEYKTKSRVSSTSRPEIKDVHFKWQTPMSPVLLKGKVTLPVRSITPLFLIFSDVWMSKVIKDNIGEDGLKG